MEGAEGEREGEGAVGQAGVEGGRGGAAAGGQGVRSEGRGSAERGGDQWEGRGGQVGLLIGGENARDGVNQARGEREGGGLNCSHSNRRSRSHPPTLVNRGRGGG